MSTLKEELFGTLQLLSGWLILAIATWIVGRLYGVPVFFGVQHAGQYASGQTGPEMLSIETLAAASDDVDLDGMVGLLPPHTGFGAASSGHSGGGYSSGHRSPASGGVVSRLLNGRRMMGRGSIPGRSTTDGVDFIKLWTGAELVFFCLLTVLACVLYYCCRQQQHKSKTWLFHLIIDPTFVTLAAVPLLLMDGLPRLSTLRRCLMAADFVIPNHQTVKNKSVLLRGTLTSIASFQTQQQTHPHSSTVDWWTDECLPVTSSMSVFSINVSSSADVERRLAAEYRYIQHNAIFDWLGVLESAIALPILLRLVRRRYKMSWTALIHSELYLALQGLDLAGLMSLVVETSVQGRPGDGGGQMKAVRLTAEVAVYLSAVYLSVCCMALATPPIYVGGHRTTQRYLAFLMLSGTFVQDLPFLAIRLWSAAISTNTPTINPSVDSDVITAMPYPRAACLFHLLLVKSAVSVVAAVIALSTRQSTTSASTSASRRRKSASGSSSPTRSQATSGGGRHGLLHRMVGGSSLMTSSNDRRGSEGNANQLLVEDVNDDDTDEHFV